MDTCSVPFPHVPRVISVPHLSELHRPADDFCGDTVDVRVYDTKSTEFAVESVYEED